MAAPLRGELGTTPLGYFLVSADHIHVEDGHDLLEWYWRPLDERPGAEKTTFLGVERRKQDRPPRALALGGRGRVGFGDRDQADCAGTVVVGAVQDQRTIGPVVIVVTTDDNPLVLELGV